MRNWSETLKGPAFAGLFCLQACAVLEPSAAAQTQVYNPDPLSVAEHQAVWDILSANGKIDEVTRFGRLTIAPEIKTLDSHSRLAEVVVMQGRETIEGIVDLDKGSVTRWSLIEGAQHPWLREEYFDATLLEALYADETYLAALKARGIEDPKSVRCMFTPPAFFGESEFNDVRLAVGRCFPTGSYTNKYPRRIEGLRIFADMYTKTIIDIDDYDPVPVPETYADYDHAHDEEDRSFPAPLTAAQPAKSGFELNEHTVEWDKWRFHIRSDQRVGIVIAKAEWKDGDDWRPVLNEGHLSEISVPYQAPQGDWYLRSPIDAGEYSGGGLSDSLVPGVHCPQEAKFMDGLIADDFGVAKSKERVICLFERANGDPTWMHDVEGRQDRSLVTRMSARLGNYDYLVDWVFSADGQIQVRLGATGIVATMNTRAESAADGTNDDAYGRFVDDNVVAVNHSHYFNFRFDFDIDGPRNDFHLGKVVPKALADDSPRKSIWVYEDDTLDTEAEGRLNGHDLWRVASSDVTNGNGYPTSYQIMAGMNAHAKIDPADWPRARAGFVDNALWVTRYKPEERFAAGDFPTQSQPGGGLPSYSTDEDIAGEDIVVWYTMGMHHVVRAEDWPVMPVLWHDVTLRPFDFHDRNAALTLPLTTEAEE